MRRNDLELSVGAIAWLLIFSPSAELCGMTESVALHVVVSDFHHQLGPERLPRQILSLTPAALAARHAADSFSGFLFRPALPRMIGERVFAIGLKELCKLEPFFITEAGANAHMLQTAAVIEQSKQ